MKPMKTGCCLSILFVLLGVILLPAIRWSLPKIDGAAASAFTVVDGFFAVRVGEIFRASEVCYLLVRNEMNVA